MRCSCQNCGTYMVQDEKGLQSRCICPQCFTTCNACMGTVQRPEHKEGLELIAFLRERYDERISSMEEEPERPTDEDLRPW